MLRSAKAAREESPSTDEFHEIQVESFKRLQFLEFGWKGSGQGKDPSHPVQVSVCVSSGSDSDMKNKSFEVNKSECEWEAGNGALENGFGGEKSPFTPIPLEVDPGYCESPQANGSHSSQAMSTFSRSDISPYVMDNDGGMDNKSPLNSQFEERDPAGTEPYYYSPNPPPCSCACIANDGGRSQGLPGVFSTKESHLSLPIPRTPPHEGKSRPHLLLQKGSQHWETGLDLIVPVSEANNYMTWTPVSTSTPTYPSSLDVQDDLILSKSLNSKRVSKLSVFSQTNSTNYTLCNSHHTILPETSFSPAATCDGSILQSSPSQSTRPSKRKQFICGGRERDFRKICVVCGLLIATAGVVGVFFAMEMKTLKKNDSQQNLVQKLLSEVPLIDGHNDLAWNLRKFLQNQLREVNFDTDLTQHEPFSGSAWSQTDLIRLREGHVGAQLWSAYVPCSAQHLNAVQIAVEQIDVIQRLVDKYPGSLRLVTSVKEVERSHQEKRIASLIGVEGGHAIGNSLAVLRMLYNLGARYLTLTHNCNTPWAGSASSENYLPERGGLTEFGKLVVLEMNRLGMMVDLAHVSPQTMKDGLSISRAPVIFSHSAASALCNHSRNVPDDILRLVTANGGLVMVSFYNVFIACNETASMSDVIAHIEHIRQIAGVDHVGLGAGFDGINFVPVGLEDVSKYPDLIAALHLRDAQWSEMDLKKLIGINFLRVFRQVESLRDEWKRVGVGPIEEWIPRDDLAGHRTACSYHGAS